MLLLISLGIIGALTEDDESDTPPPASVAPVDNIQYVASKVVGERLKYGVLDPISGIAGVDFQIAANRTLGMEVDGARRDSFDIAKAVCETHPEVEQIYMMVWGNFEDTDGNIIYGPVILIYLTRATVEKINQDGFDPDSFPKIADKYKDRVKFK